ncbi:unnamed protein product, partial [Ectocarpus sp. 8 AP-2014]
SRYRATTRQKRGMYRWQRAQPTHPVFTYFSDYLPMPCIRTHLKNQLLVENNWILRLTLYYTCIRKKLFTKKWREGQGGVGARENITKSWTPANPDPTNNEEGRHAETLPVQERNKTQLNPQARGSGYIRSPPPTIPARSHMMTTKTH